MTIRWGVAGTGGIAERFATAMTSVEGGSVVAVASRTRERAEAFGEPRGIARRHRSYEALAADPDVDAVYVATPHSRHESDTLLFLEAGKHVLCEKPLALNAAQVARMVATAQARNLFLMEAIWSRFLPAYVALADLLDAGRLGTIRQVEASFGFAMPMERSHRLYDPALGGGALLDLGMYPLQLCSWVLGPPDRIQAEGHVGETGVDEQVAAVLHHPGGAIGVVQAAIRCNLRCDARIVGDAGTVHLPAFMHCPEHLVVTTAQGQERIDAGWEGDGLRFQVDEVHRCLSTGAIESPGVPHEESLRLASAMDEIRRHLGVSYAGEWD